MSPANPESGGGPPEMGGGGLRKEGWGQGHRARQEQEQEQQKQSQNQDLNLRPQPELKPQPEVKPPEESGSPLQKLQQAQAPKRSLNALVKGMQPAARDTSKPATAPPPPNIIPTVTGEVAPVGEQSGQYLKFLQTQNQPETKIQSINLDLATKAPESRAYEIQQSEQKPESRAYEIQQTELKPEIKPEVKAEVRIRPDALFNVDNQAFEAANCVQTMSIDTASGIRTITTMLPDSSSTRIECSRPDGTKTITLTENLRSNETIMARPMIVRDLDATGNLSSETKYNYFNPNAPCVPTAKRVITASQTIDYKLDDAGQIVDQRIVS